MNGYGIVDGESLIEELSMEGAAVATIDDYELAGEVQLLRPYDCIDMAWKYIVMEGVDLPST